MIRLRYWLIAFGPAAGILVFGLGGEAWESARLAREHHELATELAMSRGERTPVTQGEPSHGAEEIAVLTGQIAEESSRLDATLAKVSEAEKQLPVMSDEELRSLGRMGDFARNAAAFIEQVVELTKLLQDKSAKSRNDDAIARATQQIGKWSGWLELVGQMEDEPLEIAQLHAQTIAERLGLDTATTARLQETIANEFSQLTASGLVHSKRPAPGEAMNEWNHQRSEAIHAAAGRVEELIPPEQRQPWVVEQSLQLGNALRQQVSFTSDGHGSMTVAVVLPGIQL